MFPYPSPEGEPFYSEVCSAAGGRASRFSQRSRRLHFTGAAGGSIVLPTRYLHRTRVPAPKHVKLILS